jgi:hypothetical protein
MDELLTTAQACKMLGICQTRLYTLAKTYLKPKDLRRFGRIIMWTKDQIKFLSKSRRWIATGDKDKYKNDIR